MKCPPSRGLQTQHLSSLAAAMLVGVALTLVGGRLHPQPVAAHGAPPAPLLQDDSGPASPGAPVSPGVRLNAPVLLSV